MVTGTKGKTTTTRMLAHILEVAGHTVGHASTDGIIVGGRELSRDDSAGYDGARVVLNDRSVTAVVLEIGRGGLMAQGLYVDRCDAAALINVGREQIDMDGVGTVQEMAKIKQRVINTARKAVVLNADDENCRALIGQYPPTKVVLFSLHDDNPAVSAHVRQGGRAYVRSRSDGGDEIRRRSRNSWSRIISIAGLPSCWNGILPQNIANAMAAAALAEGMEIPVKTTAAALGSFHNSIQQSPGRFNIVDGYAQHILLDHASSVPACGALVESLSNISMDGRKLCMFHTFGDRPDWHYTELCEILGRYFDRFVCYEREVYRRGRDVGEISDLLKARLIQCGVSKEHILTGRDPAEATRQLSNIAETGDLVVILGTDVRDYLPIFRREYSARHLDPDDERTPTIWPI